MELVGGWFLAQIFVVNFMSFVMPIGPDGIAEGSCYTGGTSFNRVHTCIRGFLLLIIQVFLPVDADYVMASNSLKPSRNSLLT